MHPRVGAVLVAANVLCGLAPIAAHAQQQLTLDDIYHYYKDIADQSGRRMIIQPSSCPRRLCPTAAM